MICHRAAARLAEARLAWVDWGLVELPARYLPLSTLLPLLPYYPPDSSPPHPRRCTTPTTTSSCTVHCWYSVPAFCRPAFAAQGLPLKTQTYLGIFYFFHEMPTFGAVYCECGIFQETKISWLFVWFWEPWIWQPPVLTAGARFKAQLRLLHLTTHNYHHDSTAHISLTFKKVPIPNHCIGKKPKECTKNM